MSDRRALALTVIIASGCGPSLAPGATMPERPGRPRIVALPTGTELDEAAFVAALLDVRAIYVGERHDSELDHRAQAWVVELVATRDPSIALGLEMVQRPFQGALDEWAAGTIDDAAFLARVEWDERWHLDFALYRPILLAARHVGGHFVALNAPREWTRPIARGGLESLDEATRAALPALDLDATEHRAMVLEGLSAHPGHGGEAGMDPAMLENFYVAQLVWDETMGEGVSRVLSALDAPHRMIVVAGRMHVQRGLGIPRCAARRMPELTSVVVLPLTEDEARAEIGSAAPLADYALVVE